MGARYLTILTLVGALLCGCEAIRHRRQLANVLPGQPAEAKAYQPPLLSGGPVASSATIQNSYQPPISLIRSNEYQSPLSAPQSPYPGNGPRSYQPLPQSYVLQNQPQHQSQSVQYVPPAGLQQSFSIFQQPKPATSFSVHQQLPQHQSQGQASFAILSDNSGLPQSTAERTYSTHSKVVGSGHVPAQAIHKAPASEIQPEKGSAAKEKDNKNEEYVVYYYYYYDNETTGNNNLSLNFDDIPSLESYDNDKLAKEPEKSASARALSTNVNSLDPAGKPDKDAAPPSENIASQPRSVGETYVRPDRPGAKPLEETVVQPLKPISNIFRYGSNEVPRFPVLPNFIVTEVPTTPKPEIITADTLTSEYLTTQPAQVNSQPELKSEDSDDDDLNNVLDNTSDIKGAEDKVVEEEPTTTITTTTTEPPTTTEEPTTTTEKSRRRPSLGGGRRRFNPSQSSSFTPTRNRQPSGRSSTSSSSTTTTTTTRPPTRRSFQASRVRPRPSIGSNRPRPGSRVTEENEDKADSKVPEATTASTTTTTSRSRFTSASPRRFQSSRTRGGSQVTSSTSTTTRAPFSSTVASRSRPASRPRPNLITRNRPARPGFLKPRPGSEPEEPETTTAATAPTEEETPPESIKEELPSTNDESNETEEEEETSEEETEEPTTTERSRFSALFKPRNRNALGNRPRPVIGNRPSRS